MTGSSREAAAVEAIARAMHKGWPARMIGKAAPGWAEVLLARCAWTRPDAQPSPERFSMSRRSHDV